MLEDGWLMGTFLWRAKLISWWMLSTGLFLPEQGLFLMSSVQEPGFPQCVHLLVRSLFQAVMRCLCCQCAWCRPYPFLPFCTLGFEEFFLLGRAVDLTQHHLTHNQHAARTFTAVFSTSVVVSVCVRFSSSGHAALHRPHVHLWFKKRIASHGSGSQDSDGRRKP